MALEEAVPESSRSRADECARLGGSSARRATAAAARFIVDVVSRSLLLIERGPAPRDLPMLSANSFAVWNRRFGSRSSALKNHASNEAGMSGRSLDGTG